MQQQREQAVAKIAFALMSECDVTPTPNNFELFYQYASGENPHLVRVMGAMVTERRPFTPEVIEQLRKQNIAAAKAQDAVETLGESMAHTIESALERIGAAGRDAKAYGQTLSAAQGTFDNDQSPEAMRKMIAGLNAATRAMETRTRSLEEELQRSSHEVQDLKMKLDDVRKESLTDPLTGVANRKAFDVELGSAVVQAQTEGHPMSLLMCDIDHFKKFNDTWGHQTGDQVLRLVANCLSENVKGRDTAARYGGEEFAVVLRNTELPHAIILADQIRKSVEGKKLVKKSTGDILGQMTISIGVAQFNGKETPADVIRRADACLYAAKRSGRNMVIGEHDPRALAGQVEAA